MGLIFNVLNAVLVPRAVHAHVLEVLPLDQLDHLLNNRLLMPSLGKLLKIESLRMLSRNISLLTVLILTLTIRKWKRQRLSLMRLKKLQKLLKRPLMKPKLQLKKLLMAKTPERVAKKEVKEEKMVVKTMEEKKVVKTKVAKKVVKKEVKREESLL